MYKLTLGSINEIKSGNGYSGTIEKDRVALHCDDGYLQVDGNFGTNLVQGLTKTFSNTLDTAEIAFIKEKYSAKNLQNVALYCWDGEMVAQSSYESESSYIDSLVNAGKIVIQNYSPTRFKLNTVVVKEGGTGGETAGSIQVAGETGDTLGTITYTVDGDGVVNGATITVAGSYRTKVASQDITIGTHGAELTVTMTEI